MTAESSARELEPVVVEEDDSKDASHSIRRFTLSLNDVTVELCSLGASITRLLLPSSSSGCDDDVVLGF
jgi:hypothetical protein